ncbi:hypothetical protein PsorP6_014072 [Peronosclerospora sorghi]|uniref:Uncharacterized protein n=1 Tax=Peronosclerospora sorghi TaxID=230839 RepID=A0ACC0VHG6_9STRA|nr:hypothetical protein PsorP6_014072 [Peronosclerospora sorghi]
MFGLLIQWIREFSLSDLLNPSRKLDEIAMLHSRDKQKEFCYSWWIFWAEDVIPSEADDGIKVDRSGVDSVAELIETALLQLLNLTIRKMKNLLNRAGF